MTSSEDRVVTVGLHSHDANSPQCFGCGDPLYPAPSVSDEQLGAAMKWLTGEGYVVVLQSSWEHPASRSWVDMLAKALRRARRAGERLDGFIRSVNDRAGLTDEEHTQIVGLLMEWRESAEDADDALGAVRLLQLEMEDWNAR